MENINTVKVSLLGLLSVTGAWLTNLFGGWDSAMTTLLIFMGIDYLTGLIVAGIFHKSQKSENGALDSKAGFKGLCKKGIILLTVLVAVRLDMMLETQYIKDATVMFWCANELISFLENAELMGLPIPTILRNALDIVQGKVNRNDEI